VASAAYRYRYPIFSSASFFHELDQEKRERETANEEGKERERKREAERRRREKFSGRKYLQNHEEYSAAFVGHILSLSSFSCITLPHSRYYTIPLVTISQIVAYLEEAIRYIAHFSVYSDYSDN